MNQLSHSFSLRASFLKLGINKNNQVDSGRESHCRVYRYMVASGESLGMRPAIQWILSNTDTLGTKIIVLISEVSLFQGENDVKLRLSQVSWLTRRPYFSGVETFHCNPIPKPLPNLLFHWLFFPYPVEGIGACMAVNSHHNYLLVHGADGTYIICPACVLFHSYGENLISGLGRRLQLGRVWASHWHVVRLSLILHLPLTTSFPGSCAPLPLHIREHYHWLWGIQTTAQSW